MPLRSTHRMTLDEYIEALQSIRLEFGNLDVEKFTVSTGRVAAPRPEIAYRKVYPVEGTKKGFIPTPHFWSARYDDEKSKGERVVRV